MQRGLESLADQIIARSGLQLPQSPERPTGIAQVLVP